MTSIELLLCAALVAISSYLSASEIALFSLSRFQLRSLKENFRSAHRKIKKLLGDPGGLLISILVANEVVNISLSTLITGAISRAHFPLPNALSFLPHWAFETLCGIVITAPVILILCEVTPKVIGAQVNQVVAPLTAGPLTFLYETFRPIRIVLKKVIGLVSPRKGPMEEVGSGILKESDFMLIVEEGHKEGAIEETELDLIRNVFRLDNTTTSEVATPINQVLSFHIGTTLKEALDLVRSHRFSRIPVLSPNRKEVVGILYSKDLLRSKLQNQTNPPEVTVSSLMKRPFFVPSGMRLNALFRKFKENKTHMAIVKGPTGEVTGVVTMSDVLDALFEDFFGEEEDKPTEKNRR